MNIEKEKIGKLIKQIQSGNEEAFNELYRITSPKAYFVAFKILRNEQDAEDVLQESYIIVLEKINEIDPSKSFMGWLYRIVSNKSKNLLKKRNALSFDAYEEVFEDVPEENSDFDPEESLDKNEICREVMAAIDELSNEKRICIILKYFGEMTVDEVAESLEVPESTVRNRLFIARKELKNKLEKKDATVFCSAAPIALAVWALGRTAEVVSAEFAASAVSTAVLSGIGVSYATAASAVVTTTTASTTAVSAGTGVAAKVAALSVTQKVVAGVAAASIIGGSTAGVVTVVKNNNIPENETTSYIEEVTTAPSQIAEYVFEHITETEISTSETERESERTTREKQTVSNTSTTKHITTAQTETKPVTTHRETTAKQTTTQKVTTTRQETTTKQETTTQAESTTQAETTTQSSTTETTVQQVATLIIDVTDMDDNVVDTLTLPVDAGTEMTWDFLITLISQNGYEAMSGVYGDGVGAIAQAGETYNFTAEL